VSVPSALQSELTVAMEAAGIPVPDSEERWQQAFTALKVMFQTPHASQYHFRDL